MTTTEAVQSIVIHGRRWFNRSTGNTYHSAEIIVNGKTVHSINYMYGYGDQYLLNARNWLDANGYLPGIENKSGTPGEAIWRYCGRMGIVLNYNATDVLRKKDL